MSGFIGILAVAYLFHHAGAAIVFSGPGTINGNAGTASVAETSNAGDVLFAFTTSTEGVSPTYVFTSDGNPNSVAIIDGKNVKLATSKSVDYETTKSLVFKISGNDADKSSVTLTVTLTITNRLEFAKTSYEVCVAEGTVAATVVGTYTADDAVKGKDTVTYSNAPNTDMIVDGLTGALKVATGKTLTSVTTGGYTTTITATAATVSGSSAVGTTSVKVTVGGCSGAGQSGTGQSGTGHSGTGQSGAGQSGAGQIGVRQIQFMAILLLIPLLLTRIF